MSGDRNKQLSRIRRAAGAVELRMRLTRSLRWLPTVLTGALGISAVTLAVHKVFPEHLRESTALTIMVVGGSAVVLAFLIGLLKRLPPHAGSRALDDHHGLSSRLTNAIEFEALPADDRTPMMEMAIDDAVTKAKDLSPRKAFPIRIPADFALSALVAGGVVGIALLEIRTIIEHPPPNEIDPLVMAPDDIELFRDLANELKREDQSDEVKAAIERFNQLIEDIANRRLERADAFRKMEEFERDLLKGAEADLKALEEEFRETGKQLEKSELTKKVGEALKKRDLDKAEKELKEVAKRLRDKSKPPSKAELDRLREALAKAAARRKEALAAVNEQRAAAREQLLKKKKDVENAPPEKKEQEESLLKKKKRELERLDREAQQRERLSRQLDRLDRELAEAAANLAKELGLSAEDLEQAAEDLNRMEQEAMSQEDKERLRQRIEELREILRQQKQGGKGRQTRMVRFGQKARGMKPGDGSEGQQGQGQGQQGQGQEGQGQEGQGQQPGQGQGQGQGDLTIGIGPGGDIPLPVPGGSGQGQGDQPGGQGSGEGGDSYGSGRGPDLMGEKTNPDMGTSDVEAVAADTGQGPTNSEVILSAAERGFRGAAYSKVFDDYRTVAEDNMAKEDIPDGYRFYVQRYFQLIRPRE